MIAAVKKVSSISRAGCRKQAMDRFEVRVIAKRYLDISDAQRKRVVILSTHQPAANPRAMKEYETLKEMGYWVKFLYSYNTDWSYRIDKEKFEKGLLSRQDLVEVGGNPHDNPVNYFMSRLIHRGLRKLSVLIPFKDLSFARTALPLYRKVGHYPADIYIAHYLGALPAAIRGAKEYGGGLIFDAEDFHRGEHAYYNSQVKDVVSVEDRLFKSVNAITTASPLITVAYKKYYPKQLILTVNNVFSKRFLQQFSTAKGNELKLFWFSQHLGVFRGLEIFIEALNYLPDAEVSLTIMGNIRSKNYQEELVALSKYPERILFKDTVAPEDLFAIAAGYHIGLAGEMPNFINKEFCLSNKIFTYLLAGNCILASDMQGQRIFIEQHPGIGFTYKHDDAKDLADKIKLLYENRDLLERCQNESRKLAEIELNWEEEKISWLKLVQQILNKEQVVLEETES
jgi:glycosyltransferase involved in cell wall biosynthesis